MMRLFIGVGLSAQVRDALHSAVDGLRVPGRLPDKNNYHLTLAFLGGREAKQVPILTQIVTEAATACAPFWMTIRGMGYFGRRDNALLYATPENSKPLITLANSLRALLTGAGEFFDDKPFRSHITLARKADLTSIRLPAALPPMTSAAKQLTLYHSARVQEKLCYLPLHGASLKENA